MQGMRNGTRLTWHTAAGDKTLTIVSVGDTGLTLKTDEQIRLGPRLAGYYFFSYAHVVERLETGILTRNT